MKRFTQVLKLITTALGLLIFYTVVILTLLSIESILFSGNILSNLLPAIVSLLMIILISNKKHYYYRVIKYKIYKFTLND